MAIEKQHKKIDSAVRQKKQGFFEIRRLKLVDLSVTEIKGVPTSNPGGTGKIWSDGGTLKIT